VLCFVYDITHGLRDKSRLAGDYMHYWRPVIDKLPEIMRSVNSSLSPGGMAAQTAPAIGQGVCPGPSRRHPPRTLAHRCPEPLQARRGSA